jgi:hypothetical protein
MVEERRLSLAFMDEVLYFQRRAMRWCEPPIFYKFLREDLSDPVKTRKNAVEPLVRMLENAARVGVDDADAFQCARCYVSLRVMADHAPEFYALDPETVAYVRKTLAAHEVWLEDASNVFAVKCKEAANRDVRAAEDAALTESMSRETLGVLEIAPERMCAVVHEKGRPRWGPVRATRSLVDKDRKAMREAIRSGTLDTLLCTYRCGVLASVNKTRLAIEVQ